MAHRPKRAPSGARMTVSSSVVSTRNRSNAAPSARQRGAAPPCPVGFLYTVQPGDTLSELEGQLGVWIDDILDANPQLDDSDRLTPGQQLCIPFVEPDYCPSDLIVEVIEGDTLASLAAEYGVSVDDLMEFNPHLVDPDRILPGFRLCMPEGANAAGARRRPANAKGKGVRRRSPGRSKSAQSAPIARTQVHHTAIPYRWI